MKRTALLLAVLLALSGPALADPFGVGSEFYWCLEGTYYGPFIAAGQGTLYTIDGSPNGPFLAVTDPHGTFKTFCVEHEVYFSPGTEYWYSIDASAYSGGVGPSGDPISKETDWMYRGYLDRTITGYTDTNFRDAIWIAEEEISYATASAGAKALYTAAVGATGGDYDAKTQALNLWGPGSGIAGGDPDAVPGVGWVFYERQSHLYAAPAPGAALLGALGLGLAAWIKRRPN